MKATTKREISPSAVERIVDEIESELRTRGKTEIASREVGELVMDKLRSLDDVAYIRFASVYRSFMDLQEVKQEIDQLLSKDKKS
jgi:transcriptional repressor NrdR